MKRIQSIDFMRGLVMIIMALDHTRDLIHINSLTQIPTNLQTTTVALFFTRLVTHICAPVFVFLAGTSAFLSFQRLNDFSASRRFLVKRGLSLILLEFTLGNFLLFFDIRFHTLLFGVIATIGVGFILLAALLRLTARTIGLIGLVIMFTHNLLPLIPFKDDSVIRAVLSPLFALAVFPLPGKINLIIAYSPIPWAGIMLAGFGFGKAFLLAIDQRRKLMRKIAAISLILFVLLRIVNVYGDPAPWSVQPNSVYTILSLLNVTKYPPSLQFCLLTLGIMFLILSLTSEKNSRLKAIVSVYGGSPLFYYFLHFLVIHLVMFGIILAQGVKFSEMEFAAGTFGRPAGAVSGLPLAGVYTVWITVVVLLYLPCRWYSKYKATHSQWWLRYL
jgi:uncharacterized membrane protein